VKRTQAGPNPVDAGAIDGAYYADLMASHGVRKVDFDLVGAKEMRNPRWNSKTPDDGNNNRTALQLPRNLSKQSALK
jgi:hypothetical protein